MIVDIIELKKCLKYLRSINKEQIKEIIWVKGSEKLEGDSELLDQWIYTGLSNYSFPESVGWLDDKTKD